MIDVPQLHLLLKKWSLRTHRRDSVTPCLLARVRPAMAWGSDMAEAALAISPATIPRKLLSWDAGQILGCADLYARKRSERVVFFADLTRMFTTAGTSWADLRIDCDNALQELQDAPIPALFLIVSVRAYTFICNPARRIFLYEPNSDVKPAEAERELVRQALAARLTADWPSYIQGLIDTGHLRLAY